MPSSLGINQYDSSPLLMQVLDKNGQPKPLTGIDAVKIFITTRSGLVIRSAGDCAIVDVDEGIVSYTPGPGETDVAATYNVQLDLRRAIESSDNDLYQDDASETLLLNVPGTLVLPRSSISTFPFVTKAYFQVANVFIPTAFRVTGLDAWGVEQIVEGTLFGNGPQAIGLDVPWKQITELSVDQPEGYESEVTSVRFKYGPTKYVATHGRTPARGYLDLFVQAALP